MVSFCDKLWNIPHIAPLARYADMCSAGAPWNKQSQADSQAAQLALAIGILPHLDCRLHLRHAFGSAQACNGRNEEVRSKTVIFRSQWHRLIRSAHPYLCTRNEVSLKSSLFQAAGEMETIRSSLNVLIPSETYPILR